MGGKEEKMGERREGGKEGGTLQNSSSLITTAANHAYVFLSTYYVLGFC